MIYYSFNIDDEIIILSIYVILINKNYNLYYKNFIIINFISQ